MAIQYEDGGAPEELLDALSENLPYNLEAEQSVLGSLLLEPDAIADALEYLKPDSFYREQHRDIFSVILKMFTAGGAIDFVTVLDEVVKAGVFDSPESAKLYLAQLMEIVPTASNLENYCRIVQEKYYLRALILTARDIISMARDGDGNASELLDAAEQRIYDIRRGRDTTGLVPIKEVIAETYNRLQNISGADRQAYLGLSTGFDRLDLTITGLNRADLILVAARPGMGKTSFALNIATHVAKTYPDRQVAVFSLEMSNEQVVSRVLSSEALIDSHLLRTGELTADDWIKLGLASDGLYHTQILLDDTPAITVAQMKAKLRRLKRLGLVVIDYLQLLSTGRKDGNRVLEISELTRNLKIMAKELDVPVILLSQLSRSPEQRQDHRPLLSDLRESGSIEQDADIVLFLYRDSYYDESCEHPNISECIVAKNRHGETAKVELGWNGQYTLFSNLNYKNES